MRAYLDGVNSSAAPHPAVSAARLDAATSELDPPFGVADLDAFDRNASGLVDRAGGKPIRVATKSVRCPELIDRAARTPGFSGLMCYSLAEALWLYRTGVSDDLLLAYPTADRRSLAELASDPGAASAVTITVDSAEQLDLVERFGGRFAERLRVCLEVDAAWRPLEDSALGRIPWLGSGLAGLVHIGPRRSPVRSPGQARELAREVERRRAFRLVGLMVYEGQIAGVGDAPPGQPLRAAAVRWVRHRSAAELSRRRAAVVEAVGGVAELEFVNGGGTGSLETTATERVVTEVTAGSGLIGPTLFDAYHDFRPLPSVLFALPVVRRPGRRCATLFAGGYPASGAAGRDRLPSPYLPSGLRLTGTEAVGEVQTPVVGRGAGALRPGDRVWFRHAKAGELAERLDEYHLIEWQDATRCRRVGSARTYRGAGRSFG
ncbi:D-serine deaminase, pyridoxal phosphate-dependent [Actinopolyspora saharensis]|uniref:D-serine deaminase, pyridoxal phosphate-dependent n=1 Tax=Actinopolyspora saharensis TaxID=995062 RepID=A0A1H1FLU6_9ACTN|nr:D-serine deaminase, pyridoxal phosphate-dependent [Actinopolyspora saharensis]